MQTLVTSLVVHNGDEDENIFMSLLQIPSIQETLDDFTIYDLDISECTSVVKLLVEFERIKTVKIEWLHSLDDDEFEEWKLKIKQFEKILKKKHSQIHIYIGYRKINYYDSFL